MSDPEGTAFGQPFSPEQKDEAGAPRVCANPDCGGVDTIRMYHNIESDELTLECEDCGREYDSEQSYILLALLKAATEMEEAGECSHD